MVGHETGASPRGEPRRWLLLAALVGVIALADASPLWKLRPPSVVLGALVGVVDGPRASAFFALLVAGVLAGPALALGWVIRRPLIGGSRARLLNPLLSWRCSPRRGSWARAHQR